MEKFPVPSLNGYINLSSKQAGVNSVFIHPLLYVLMFSKKVKTKMFYNQH